MEIAPKLYSARFIVLPESHINGGEGNVNNSSKTKEEYYPLKRFLILPISDPATGSGFDHSCMGMSPAPTLANLFGAIYKEEYVLPFVPAIVIYLHRFIDNGFGIWLHGPDPAVDESNWKVFKACLNNSGIQWTFSKHADEAIFMDLRLKIKGKKVMTSLYAMPLVLHLYLPPHSCHTPRVLSGLIFGNIL
jgi:hypothetical protein